ncbi:HIT family protein [Salinadaptatus halalkaliphilus]|uniref:HIT family protein n=1 Tax=Salinadaptatus halalkaliphilus TaxID=2419781 RepID=A0A4S3TJQ7_9EURY|nr:HIT family protein [Salinadaptatus halalkaliphilus]THE64292.1 HIT family protein [Salinadaptatus halalkaliphilus]
MEYERAPDCPFCDIIHDESAKLMVETEHLAGFRDAYPVNPGHILIIPRAHLTRFDAIPDIWGDELLTATSTVKDQLDQKHDPDGYNMGMNLGESAGQTIDHLHWHVIPRYTGDVSDPEGGIRGVIPEERKY